ncbi:MAG: hypothetical protein ACOC9Y_01405 [Chloroflexota bacterium]
MEDVRERSQPRLKNFARTLAGLRGRIRESVRNFFLPPGVLLSVYLLTIFIHSLGSTQTHDIAVDQQMIVRSFGNPSQAIERIERDNFVTLEHLNELVRDPGLHPDIRDVYQYAPLMLFPADMPFPQPDDTFIGVYYTMTASTYEETRVVTIQYWYFATDEAEGTVIPKRLALFGQPIDRELIYQVRLVDGEIAGAHFQAPGHRLLPFQYDGTDHPVFAIASGNHNFRPVWPNELQLQPTGYRILVPLPQDEHANDPAHDPDFVALAAREALIEHDINLSQYVYVEFQNPVVDGRVTVSTRVHGRWYHLHESIAGLTRPGYNKIGIDLGFNPEPEDVEQIRVTMNTRRAVDLEVISVYVYPNLEIAN